MTHSNTTPPFDPTQTWNARSAKDGYVFGTEPNEWLQRNASIWKSGSRILSVADGEGRNSVWLAKQGHNVDAFYISEVGVAKARRLATDNHVIVNFTVASCDDFAWPQDHYDGVATIFVQFADPELLREAFGDLDIQVMDEYETELNEGDGHKGRSAVIGLVGVRR